MNLRKRSVLGIVALTSALALTVVGCSRGGGGSDATGAAAAASPGITDTSISLGITTPLSGGTAGPGTCTVAGVTAYFGAKNAEGGVTFGDGKTRKVDIKALDDAYDPQKAKANYDQLKDSVFAMTAGLGTPTNRAYREAAIADEVPGFRSSAWFGVLAPKDTPEEIVTKLHDAIVTAVARPEVRKMFSARNVEARSSTPQELEKLIRDEMGQWGPVVRKANIQM